MRDAMKWLYNRRGIKFQSLKRQPKIMTDLNLLLSLLLYGRSL